MKIEITPELLDHIESIANKATPSPWILMERGTELHSSCDGRIICSCSTQPNNPVDIEYIQLTSPLLVLALVNHIRSLEKQLSWFAELLGDKDCPHDCPSEEAPQLEQCYECWKEATRKATEGNNGSN